MSYEDKRVAPILQKFERMETSRRKFENVNQMIRELVRFNTLDISGRTIPGQVRSQNAYDATAADASKELAAGLHSYLMNPTERFFGLAVHGFLAEDYDEEGLAWLEVVSELIYGEYNRPESGFHTCAHECFLDIAAFGMCLPYQSGKRGMGMIKFRSFPMADAYFDEDSDGKIDTVGRRVRWKKRQIEQEFGKVPPKVSSNKNEDCDYEIIHMVFPRKDRDPFKIDAGNMAVASVWICKDTKEIIDESGYVEMPYHPCRWETMAGDIYGTGPAATCLPDIVMLNVMERTLLKAGLKQVDPPLQVPNEGFEGSEGDFDTQPGSILWKETGTENIEPLLIQGNLPWGEEKAQQKRESIRKYFHADWLRMEKENKEMTAYEVSDRRNEKLGLLAPNLGRIQGEMIGPMVRRSYRILHEGNRFPPAPPSIQRRKLELIYVSPAARAQMAIRANEMGRFINEVITVAGVKPEVLDYIDFDKYMKELARLRAMVRSVIRPSAEVEVIRQQKAQQEQLAQIAQMAEPATKALKNVADAQAKGLNIGAL